MLINLNFIFYQLKIRKNNKLTNLRLKAASNTQPNTLIPNQDLEKNAQLLSFPVIGAFEKQTNKSYKKLSGTIYAWYNSEVPLGNSSKLVFLKIFKNFFLSIFNSMNTLNKDVSGLLFFFKNYNALPFYIFQGRASYVSFLTSLNYKFFFSIASQWLMLREFFFIYEFLFLSRSKNNYGNFFLTSNNLYFFASMLLYEKLNYFLVAPQLLKNFFNFSECLLKIRLTSSNFFFTALDSVSNKTLLTGTGGMLQVPIPRYSNIIKGRFSASKKKKVVLRQDIKYKKAVQSNSLNTNQSPSKKFSKKQNQNIINKKKRPRWIEKASFNSLFYLCDKFFKALKDFGYLQLRFWLIGYKVYNAFFKKKIITHWKAQYSNHLFLSPYIIFQAHRSHNGMRLKKARRV